MVRLGGGRVSSSAAGVVTASGDRWVGIGVVGAREDVTATLVLKRGLTGAAVVMSASVVGFSGSGVGVGLRIPPGRRIFFGVSVVTSTGEATVVGASIF